VRPDAKTERLRQGQFQTLEAEVAKKRVDWFKRHYGQANFDPLPSPRRAYELFLLQYLGLSADKVPVVSETETKIEWLSLNACPTLEACQRLSLDTRQVCRAVYEKSTQALLSQLDPQLRFHRSYQEIRPNAPHCRERIIRLDFARIMKLAIKEARTSKAEGNKGYGAVVILDGKVVGRAYDTATTQRDPVLHAEVNALRQAVSNLGDGNLCGAVLFSTCEPCPMCSALAVWANVTTIVYGASIEETARLGKARILMGAREIATRSPALVEVIGGVLKDECLALYS